MMNDTAQALKIYFDFLCLYPDEDELFYRTPFQNLMEAVQFPGIQISIHHEPHRTGVDVDGMPDFFVYQNENSIFSSLVGFIECKKPLFQLEKLIESEQIKKYSKTTENIIITNYKRFILLQKNAVTGEIEPTHDIRLENIDNLTITKFENLLYDFYNYQYQWIKTKKTLVQALAAQSFYYSVTLREFIKDKSNEDDFFYTKFNTLFGDYENSISYHYELADFCDIYSQSLVYGLLLARLDTEKDLDEQELDYLKGVPKSYKLLREFLSQAYVIEDLPTDIKIALTNIGKNLNLINVEEIQKEFISANNGKRSIAVFLYEDFLQQYDKLRGTENRKEGGVYYTPNEATDFITRSVNEIIKTKFDFSEGYNAENVKVLDFACGTGSFLHSVFEQMLPETIDEIQKIKAKNKITNDIYGFELLFTPYIIAHTILTRFLAEKGINLANKERLGIYLTNTLDISQHSISGHLPHLKNEYETAMKIKDREEILAIIGNPPYFNGKSKEKSPVIDDELLQYKKGLNEKKVNLDDAYIKFIRFAEWKINQCKKGIVGIITNNSFLDGVTHRQMRKHLYETFDEIYILNLHGNSRKGDADKNIFDIMVGVQICFFVKLPKPLKDKKVYYFSTKENNIISRTEKLSFLENISYKNIKWKELNPAETPYYWFVEKDFTHEKEYATFWKMTDIFKIYNSGIQTKNDNFVIKYSKKNLEKITDDFREIPVYKIKEKYKLKDGIWTADAAYKSLKDASFDKKFIRKIDYRPFDSRWTFLHDKQGFLARPRYETAKHFEKENLGICFTRNIDNKYKDIFITNKYIDIHVTGGQTYIAPLYFYNGVEHKDMLPLEFEGEGIKYANFTENFIKNYIDKLDFETTPESILAYIYAVLHSPVYRKKYIEFLKTDFPAVPMTTDKETFEKYAAPGQKLVDLHLLNFRGIAGQARNDSEKNEIRVTGDITDNDFVIEKTEHDGNKLIITKTDTQTIVFEGLTSEIYNFEIGSYRPIEKWLKYRVKDKVPLGISDLEHLQKIIAAIKNTVSTMQEIETLGEEYLELIR